MEWSSWNPWRELRARPHIAFALRPLPAATGGAVLWRRDDGRAVLLVCPSLSRRQRRCAVAHELVHDELGSSCRGEHMPAAWDAVVARHEAAIDREVAARLVPSERLTAFVSSRSTIAECIDAGEVADAFDVTVPLAELAMRQLGGDPMGWGEVVA